MQRCVDTKLPPLNYRLNVLNIMLMTFIHTLMIQLMQSGEEWARQTTLTSFPPFGYNDSKAAVAV